MIPRALPDGGGLGLHKKPLDAAIGQVLQPIDAIGHVKEYAQAEGVSAELGVASKSTIDLSCENGVSETAEYCEKVLHTSARPHVDLVPGGNGTGRRLTHADT